MSRTLPPADIQSRRYWTTRDLEEHDRRKAQDRKDRQIREFGACKECGEPRYEEARFGRYVGLRCSATPSHASF